MSRMHAILAVAATALLSFALASDAISAPESKTITGQGCVQAGVETGCLIVRDVKTGTLYSLIIKGTKPSVGLGIQFIGTPHSGPTMCMQGAAVDVESWGRKEGLQCAQPAAPKN